MWVRVQAGLCLLATIVTLGVTLLALSGVRSSLSVIGNRTAPDVVNTSGVYFALNDMDAQVANILLVADAPNLGVTRQQSLDLYEQDRQTVDKDLQQATVLTGNSPTTQPQIQAVIDGLGRYEALAAQAFLLEQQGPSSPGRPPAAALSAFRQATDLMHATVLTAAARLIAVNTDQLNRTYRNRGTVISRGFWAVLLLGLALLTALVVIQRYLVIHFNRLVNPALALAVLVALVLVSLSGLTLRAEKNHLFVAKQQAFDSIVVLAQARSVSYDANADESRYLVDPARADQYQQAFLQKTQQVVNLTGASITTYDGQLADAVAAYRSHHGDLRFTGFLGSEFRNITFSGERAAAEQTLLTFQAYQRDDRRIRSLAASGNLLEAIRFDTSYAPQDSNGAFTAYDKALTTVTQINQRAFDRAIRDGRRQLAGWTVIPIVSCVAVALLVVAGCRPRLAEYD